MNLSIEIIFLIKRSTYNCRYINKCVCVCACIYIHTRTHKHSSLTGRNIQIAYLLTGTCQVYIFVLKVHLKKHGLVLKSLHSQVMKLYVKTPWK